MTIGRAIRRIEQRQPLRVRVALLVVIAAVIVRLMGRGATTAPAVDTDARGDTGSPMQAGVLRERKPARVNAKAAALDSLALRRTLPDSIEHDLLMAGFNGTARARGPQLRTVVVTLPDEEIDRSGATRMQSAMQALLVQAGVTTLVIHSASGTWQLSSPFTADAP
jgi:hypothetical protein